MIQSAAGRTSMDREFASARMLYFGYYLALGALLPYLNLYYERTGLSGTQIGMLSAISLLVSSPTSIAWGSIADRLHIHRGMLTISVLCAPVCMLLLSRTTGFYNIIPIILAYAFSIAPIIPLLDSAALEVVRTHGKSYGQIRVGGTVGWIISVALVGALIHAFGTRSLFYAYAAFMGLTLIFTFWQPRRSASLQASWSSNVRQWISDPGVLLFLASVFLVMVGNGAVQNFFSLYLDGIGANEGIIGVAWAVAAVSEIPVMIFAGRFIRRVGAANLLKAAFFFYALRWLLFSFIHVPAWALAVQLLHGLSFAAFLTAGVTYLNERTPQGLVTTALAVFNMVSFGLATFLGALLGGYLYDHRGMDFFFRAFSLVTVAGLILFWLGWAYTGRAVHAEST